MPLEVIAEFGQSHGGDLKVAMEQAAAAKAAGCTYAKWQAFEPRRLASQSAVRYWDTSLGGSRSQLETFEQNGMLRTGDWAKLGKHCNEVGIGYMVTPFDLESVDMLVDAGVDALKLASGDITYWQLIEKVAATGKRTILSTGASTVEEVERAIEWFECATPPPDLKRRFWAPHTNLVLLACDLEYPTPRATLSKIRQLGEYGRRVGYSDHTRSLSTGELAVAAGATVLEKHVTLNPDGDVPDDKMALTTAEMSIYIERARAVYEQPAGFLAQHEMTARTQARRAIYTSRAIRAGELIQKDDVVFLRPCPRGALAPYDVDVVVGRRAVCDIPAGERLTVKHTNQDETQLSLAA